VFPFALLNGDSRLPLHFGNGQFMMFRRDAYAAIGGPAAIRDNVFEDMTLAKRMKSSGRRVVIADGSPLVTCRMYETLPAAFKGLAKNIYMLFHYSLPRRAAIPAYLLGLFWFALVMFGPLASLAIDVALVAAGFALSLPVICLSAAGIALALLSLGIVSTRFRFPPVMVVLYPLTMVLFLAAALGSLIMTRRGRTEWKGRALPQAT
jgi:chlorobactene glucosyltransferase